MEKSLAIMFADIADSTQLYERVGNVRARAMTQKFLSHLRLAIEVNGGSVIKSLGDGLLAAFHTADDACWTAGTMIDSQAVFGLELRVGFHFGTVIEQDGDVFGDACNTAARVEGLAKPGEILATEDIVTRLSPKLRKRTKLLSNVAVKGKSAPIRIYHVRNEEEEEDTVESTMIGSTLPKMVEAGMLTLLVTYRRQTFTVNRENPRLTIGREPGCSIHILSRQSSRQHAVLDFSRETFIITDHSTNGTYIRPSGGLAIVLKRDSSKLVGSGLLGFGAAPEDEAQDHVASFHCDMA